MSGNTKDFPVQLGTWVLSRGGCQPAVQASWRGWLLQRSYMMTMGIQGVQGRSPEDPRQVEISDGGEGMSEDPQIRLITLWSMGARPSRHHHLCLLTGLPASPQTPLHTRPLPSGQSGLYKDESDQEPPSCKAPLAPLSWVPKPARSTCPPHTSP